MNMTPAELKRNLQVLPREYATWEDIPEIYREVHQLLIEIGNDWHDTLPDICGGWLQARILIRIMNLYKIKEIPYDETVKGRDKKFRLVRRQYNRMGQLLTTKQIQKEFREQKNKKREISTIQKYIKELREKGLIINCNKGSKQYLYHFPMTDNIRGKLKKREREIYSLSEKSNGALSKSTKTNNREPEQTSKKVNSKSSIGRKHTANGKNSVFNLENTSNNTRLNSSENTSYFPQNYNNTNSANSVKPRLKLRNKVSAKKNSSTENKSLAENNTNKNFVNKAKQPAKKLKLRTNAKKLKDAALHSEPVDLRPEKKNKPIKRVPAKVQECIDHWNNSELRQHKINFDNPTKTLRQSIRSLKLLLIGKAFSNGHLVDNKFKNKPFTVADWKKSVDNFAKCVNDPTYQTAAKYYGKKVSIPEFIYKADWMGNGRPESHFCYNLEFEPKVVKPKYRMPNLTAAPQQLFDAFLKLLADEYSTPTNILTDEDKVYLAIFIRDFHLNLLNLYNQDKLEKTFGYLWMNDGFGPDGQAEKLMELLQSQWPGPPMSIPFDFIVNKRRIERLPGVLRKLGWVE